MLEQFGTVYDIHPWLRRAIWGVLGIAGIFLFWFSGGFPPQAWRFLFGVIPHIPRLWVLHGTTILLPLALLAIQSLSWLIAWGLLAWSYIAAIRQWRKGVHALQRFEEDIQEAHDTMTQERETLQSPSPFYDYVQSPLVVSEHKKAEHHPVSQHWQRHLPLHLNVGIDWDAGTERKDEPNEDSLIALQGTCIYNNRLSPFGFFAVADGMGGHAHGKEASYLAIQALLKSVLPNIAGSNAMSDKLIVEMLAEGVQQANLAVYRRGKEMGAEMGTTLTAALVIDTTAFLVNVGDSRGYLYRECRGLSQVTHDHSYVAHLVATGQLAPEDIYTHPDRNQIYRALGEKMNVEVDWFTFPLQVDDRLLLCSDGLWEMVRDSAIEKILQQSGCHSSTVSKALVKAALKGGGLDNISVIVVHLAPIGSVIS